MRLRLGNRSVTVRAGQAIGKGGEADVYSLGTDLALKIFKTARHPDLGGDPAAQAAAEARLQLHQTKLPAFPTGLPARVVTPLDLARDDSGRILGYSMRRIQGATPLAAFADPLARNTGLSEAQTRATLLDLFATLEAVHRRHVVVGDLNDLNILVCGAEAHLIDADSFQFGPFPCPVFTLRFADPRLLTNTGGTLTLGAPHDTASDWYAYAVLLMQSLLFVDPYAGIYRPRRGPRLPEELRPLERITVFHSEVRYPKPARPLTALPDALLHELEKIFVRDARAPIDCRLIEALSFSTCPHCALVHARSNCPRCQHAPVTPRQTVTVHGQVTKTHVFATSGRLLTVAVDEGRLTWLVHEGEHYRREDGREVLRGALDPALGFVLQGAHTLVTRHGQVAVLESGAVRDAFVADRVGSHTAIAANSRHHYWAADGQLWRDGKHGPERIGEVLAGQTRIFVGERFGIGYYRAAELCVGFVFDHRRAGLCDRLALPPIRGELMQMTAIFTAERGWLMWARQDRGQRWHTCAVVRADGRIEATLEAPAGQGPLARLGGQAASGGSLYCATDEGIVELELERGTIVVRRSFPDTERFVDQDSRLQLCADGLAVASTQEICVLRIR